MTENVISDVISVVGAILGVLLGVWIGYLLARKKAIEMLSKQAFMTAAAKFRENFIEDIYSYKTVHMKIAVYSAIGTGIIESHRKVRGEVAKSLSKLGVVKDTFRSYLRPSVRAEFDRSWGKCLDISDKIWDRIVPNTDEDKEKESQVKEAMIRESLEKELEKQIDEVFKFTDPKYALR